ncbi:MAG: hypothetical protein NC332_04610, partial [Firmicutes bacterium]|nr:hypothetical protein [Bacillota bacterium]
HLPLRKISIKTYNAVERKFAEIYDKMLSSSGADHFIVQNNVVFGEDDWLFYAFDKSLDYYRGTNILSLEEMQKYVERAEIVNDYFESIGKKFVIMIAPNKEQVYSEYMPESLTVHSQVKRLDVLSEYFKEKSDVRFVYPLKALSEAKSEYQVYYKRDTHWNAVGAYIGAMELLDSLEIPRNEATVTSEFRAFSSDLANLVTQPGVKDYYYTCAYRPEIKLSCTYADDTYICVTNNPNGQKMILIWDSFRSSMVNILSKEFSDSIFTHRDQFNKNNNYFKDEIADADVVVLQAAERYDLKIFGDGGVLDIIIRKWGLQ